MVDWRTFGIEFLVLRVGTNQPVQITGLEFVRVARKGLEIADAVIASARTEDFLAFGSQRAKRCVTSGAAAADHEPLRIGVSFLDQAARAGDAILDVYNAPSSLEPQPVGAAIAGAAAIIHVEHPNAAARPVLRRKRERARGGRRRPSVTFHQHRGLLVRRRGELGRKRGIVERMGRLPASSREGDRLRDRDITTDVLAKDERATQPPGASRCPGRGRRARAAPKAIRR